MEGLKREEKKKRKSYQSLCTTNSATNDSLVDMLFSCPFGLCEWLDTMGIYMYAYICSLNEGPKHVLFEEEPNKKSTGSLGRISICFCGRITCSIFFFFQRQW